ncbi:MAG: dihydrodipicolinate synthase family protein, partial [Myxococcota bacterium]
AGRIDVESIGKLTSFMAGLGVQGLAILGVMGEAPKLNDAEQQQVTQAFRASLPEHLGLVVGVRAAGTDPAVTAARTAATFGGFLLPTITRRKTARVFGAGRRGIGAPGKQGRRACRRS